ncbi:hypothetical protein [Pseudonocardia xishanensis]|uniref:Novel STAND NTPase 1 domain-containing protein n=1 Tax=Pseudonocardia xishanensis TaxID=630995 RepID=A0ABP8S5K4_9PSEU
MSRPDDRPPDPDAALDRAGFAAELGRMKALSGLSFRALAKRTVESEGEASGVPMLPFTTFRDYVQGRSLPSPTRLDAVLTAFGMPADHPDRERWRRALRRATEAPARPPSDLRPYAGAEPVVADLRGRHAEVAEVIARLRASPPGGVVAVTGHSGVGVTSLLKGGVAPLLPHVVELRPGPEPAERLAALLTGTAAYVLVDDVHALRDEGDRLRAALRVLLAGEPDGGPRVLLGIRAGDLADLTAPGARPVAAVRLQGPSAEALRAIMAGPAEEAGFPLAEGVADLVLGELDISPAAASSPPGALPLVADALRAAWDRAVADGGTGVTIAHYHEAGGVHGAGERAAERVYATLTPEQVVLVRPLLLRMVRGRGTHGDAETVRRRVSRSAVTYGQSPAAAATTTSLVDALVAGRVLTADETALEIAHDVVLRGWPRLAGWIAEDRDRRPARGMITEAAWVWHHTGRDAGTLLAGRLLDEASAFAADPEGLAELFPMERELLAASRAERRAREAGRTRALTAAVAVLSVALVAVVVVLVGVLVGSG